jgi:hypothetical protein
MLMKKMLFFKSGFTTKKCRVYAMIAQKIIENTTVATPLATENFGSVVLTCF